jgi:hypothetical protein
MQDTLFTNSLHIKGPTNVRERTKKRRTGIYQVLLELTATGHHQQEGHHPLDQHMQAASLISKGLPTGLQGQIDTPPHYGVHHSC